MRYRYSSVYQSIFHKVFPNISPCQCHRKNSYSPLLYNVSTMTGTHYRVGHGYIIKEVDMTCSSCGSRHKFNIECLGVSEDVLNF